LDILDTISNSPPLTIKVKTILDKAMDVYDKLCVAGSWIKVDKSTQQALTAKANACSNCGGDQSARHFKKPRDPVTFEKNKKAFEERCRASGGNNDSRSSGCQNGTGGSNVDKSLPEFNARRVVTIPPTAPSFMMPRMQIQAPYSSAPNIHMHENVLS
jgi:hypothetical protein